MAKGRRKKKPKNRLRFVWRGVMICFAILVLRLIYLQVFDSTDQYARQVDQLVDEVSLQASRGNIYDRNGNLLVQDSTASAIHVIPLEVEDTDKLANALVEKLGLKREDVLKTITKIEDNSIEVARNVSSEAASAIIAQNAEGFSYDDGTLYVTPSEVKDAEAAAKSISEKLDMTYDDAHEVVTRKKSSTVLVAGKLDNSLAKQIKEEQAIYDEKGNITSYNGVQIIEDKKRYYTNGNFASYVLGFTGQDHVGLTGVESVYDDSLSGENGILYMQKDATGNQIPSQTKVIKESKAGEDLTLTLDSNIQIMAEKALSEAISKWKAKSGTVIVMDTKTGEILSMATKPDYDLNDPYELSESYASTHKEDLTDKSESDQLGEMWKNPAVSFIYEPGSTFKAIMASAALEEGVVSPDTTVYCPGYITVNGVTINCTGNHGTQTVSQAIANSCNPGMVQIIQKMDPNLFYQYIYNFGYGETTGIELTGEESGLVNRIFDSNGEFNMLDYSTLSFGQGLAATPIQMISALNCVVNYGYYMNPTIIAENSKQQEYIDGKLDSPKQIISADTSAEMRAIMKEVVSGTPALAQQSEGYSIGGKTGTAEKFVDGAYSSTRFVTSFYCYAPIEDPKYSILLLLDEPDPSAYGGTSAAPYAIDLMKQILGSSGEAGSAAENGSVTVPSVTGQEKDTAVKLLEERGIKYRIEQKDEGTTVISQSIEAQTTYDGTTELVLEVGTPSAETASKVTVPDLTGMSIQAVNETITGLGLNLKVSGSGFAKEQSVAAGTVVDKGSEITVTFSP
ncbi:MAG: penicillin-binding transpeptidase domain-containing protein [Eubacterium sp.]|nr:penicillin-binding transpeptidase domain-containing protein [Eubacterium sp.]